jgi:hypothetical protein
MSVKTEATAANQNKTESWDRGKRENSVKKLNFEGKFQEERRRQQEVGRGSLRVEGQVFQLRAH